MDRLEPPLPLQGLPLLLAAAAIAVLALSLAVQLAKPPAKGPAGASVELNQEAERQRLIEQSAAARERLLAAMR